MKSACAVLAGVLAASHCLAASRTVSKADEFVQALQDLNGNSANEIVLKAGPYDVSGYEMETGFHLKLDKLTVRGESSDPRAVVIYGDFTKGIAKAGNGCNLRNVTLSNGCVTANAPFYGNWSHTAICSNVVFTCNKGKTGGAAILAYCRDCLFVGNEATASGGAGFNLKGMGCRFVRNTAPRGGALATNQDGYEFSDSLFEDNISTSDKSTEGGGAACSVSTGAYLVFRKCLFRGNASSSKGGAAVICKLFDRCVVSNNVAATCGGGVSDCIVVSSDILFNSACNDSSDGSSSYYAQGGGMYATVATDCTIAGNASYRTSGKTSLGGGAAGGSVLTNCVVKDNFCNAGSALQGGVAVGCVITNNAAANGGVTIRDAVRLENCHLYGATADAPGVCVGCTFRGTGTAAVLQEGANAYASGTFASGSALFSTSQNSGMAATNCLFEGNVVSTFCYRGNDANSRLLPFVNCTISGNRFDAFFSGLKAMQGEKEIVNPMMFENCIVANNLSRDGSEKRDFYADAVFAEFVTVRNCLLGTGFKAGWSCPHEFDVITNDVVRFDVKNEAHPYSIRYGSPARGKGIVRGWMTAVNDIRGEGYPRLRDGSVDIGCYQCWSDPSGMVLLFR